MRACACACAIMPSDDRCCELAIWLTTPALGGAGLDTLGIEDGVVAGAGASVFLTGVDAAGAWAEAVVAVMAGTGDEFADSGRPTGGRAMGPIPGRAMPIVVGGREMGAMGRVTEGDMDFEAGVVTPGGGGGELAGGYAAAPLLCWAAAE